MKNKDSIVFSQQIQYGASKEEWVHFDLLLGLTTDLLPVVSSPEAVISPDSKMRDKGKTPSLYNKRRQVAGIPNWTQHVTSDQEATRWAKEPDYGICLQTREVRALDVDVPDPEQAQIIREFIDIHLNGGLPCRRRSNSGKFLYAFRLPGDYAKRTMKVESGIIEFLATGQQFVAIGTHPSGARYEWEGGLPDDFPTLSSDEFESLWFALAKEFATQPPAEARISKRDVTAIAKIDDPVVGYLWEQGHVLSPGKGGQLFITCPFGDEHSSDSGETSTVYFPAGTGGYEQGHFKCLHAHCEGRSNEAFLDAVGYRLNDFDIVETPAGTPEPFPSFKRDQKGEILATNDNLAKALSRPDFCGMRIQYDQFRDEIMWMPNTKDADEKPQWRPFTDPDYVDLLIALERRGFKPVSQVMIRSGVVHAAAKNIFDSAISWLDTLRWDGSPRVENFFQDYFGTEGTEYIRAVSIYLWTALAGRVMKPGCKADMVPILVGEQGRGKSTAISTIAPSMDYFTEISFHEKDDDLARKMRGRLVAEIGELRGLHSKELESIKAFITRTHENWIPKFREFAVTFPRRLVFIGTTNKDEFLADETGNRRWLPVRIKQANVPAIENDRDQLWAEAKVLFDQHGVCFRDAERLAGAAHEAHMISDSWEGIVSEWLDAPEFGSDTTPRTREFLQVHEVLKEALGFDSRNISRREEMRVAKVLRSLGYDKKDRWVKGKSISVWFAKS